jgi:MYXO-CTERM domain-containing protein
MTTKNRRSLVLTAATIVLASAAPALASLTIHGSAGSGWQPFPAALNDYHNDARAFWDQDTMDRAGSVTNRNIGNYLSGTYTGSLPGGAIASPNITPAWWGRSGAHFTERMDHNIGFQLGASASVATTMRLEVAGHRNANTIGWFSVSDAVGSESLNPIFSGPDGPGTSASFAPSVAFGLYIRTGTGEVFFSQSHRNRAADGSPATAQDRATQHFAIFQTSDTPGLESFIVGVEDLNRASAGREQVGDYNDLVLSMTAVPTPGAAAVLGLAGLAAARRRR